MMSSPIWIQKKEEEWSSGQLEGKSERIKSEQVAFKHLATPCMTQCSTACTALVNSRQAQSVLE